MESHKRTSGFYWVYWSGWVVAKWDGEVWWIPGRDDDFCDNHFETINEQEIKYGII